MGRGGTVLFCGDSVELLLVELLCSLLLCVDETVSIGGNDLVNSFLSTLNFFFFKYKKKN